MMQMVPERDGNPFAPPQAGGIQFSNVAVLHVFVCLDLKLEFKSVFRLVYLTAALRRRG
jgi:hypothetical protein